MSDSKLRALGQGLAEATLLVAAWTVPLLLNHYGLRIADLPKSALLLALASLGGLGAVMAAAESRQRPWRAWLGQPLVAAALMTGLSAGLATLLAAQPRLSFLGSGERAMGLVGILALLALFAAALGLGRDPARAERLVVALAAASGPVAVWALTQAMGLMPVPGRMESASRVFGSLTNPIFLGAYLMLLLPFALWLSARAFDQGRRGAALGWAGLVVLQLAALVLSQSRGPILGLAAAGLVALLAAARLGRRRGWAALALGLGAAGLLFLALLNRSGGPLDGLKGIPLVARFAELGETERSSSSARLRIWRSGRRLLAAQPGVLAFGRGPEALKYALLPYGEPYMAGRGQQERLVDRAHNVLLDSLIMTGLPGALALYGLYLGWLAAAAGLAGLCPDRRRRSLWLSLGAGALLGLLPWFWGPATEAPGVYAPALSLLAPLLGLVGWLLLGALRGGAVAAEGAGEEAEGAPAARDSRGLGLAFLAAGTALAVEAAFGIRTVGTELVVWSLAGLLASLGLARAHPAAPGAAAPAPAALRRGRRPGEADAPEGASAITFSARPEALSWGLALGAALSTLSFSLHLHQVPASGQTWAVLLLCGLAVLAFGGLAGAELGIGGLAAALVGFGTGLAYVLLRILLLGLGGEASLLWLGTALWLLLLAGLAALWLRPSAGEDLSRLGVGAALFYPLLLVPAMSLVFALGLLRVRADIVFQSALASFDAAMASGDDQARVDALFEAANRLYDQAVGLNRFDDSYPLLFGERYLRLGTAAGGNLQAAALAFQRSQDLVARAEALDPAMPFHKVNRGRLQLRFAQALGGSSPEQAAGAAANAELALREAFALLPYDPAVVNELATAMLLQGDPAKLREALQLLEVSRDKLDAQNPQTLRLLAQAYRESDRPQEAEAALAAALQLVGPQSPERAGLLVGQAELAREAGRLDDAESLYRQALIGGAAGDWRLLFNFALVLGRNGKAAEAQTALQEATRLAPAEAQEQIRAALAQLGGAAPAPEGSLPGVVPGAGGDAGGGTAP